MRELRQQLQSALLMVMMVAAVIAAAINFQQQQRFHLPEDGATWVDQSVGTDGQTSASVAPVAVDVVAGSPADKAGIRVGDELVSIAGVRVDTALEATQVLASLGPWRQAEYRIVQNGVEATARVVIGEAAKGPELYYQYAVGAIYLAIGLYVFFRRSNAPRATQFFLLCLTSFILYTFHYTGKLNNFDKVIYWGNSVGWCLAPSLFLHFCFSFPNPQRWIQRRGAAFLVYLPGLLLLAVQIGFALDYIRTSVSLIEVRWLLDRTWLAYLCAMYLGGAGVVAYQMRGATDPITRRQLTWLRNGALAGVLPFAIFYAVPFIAGVAPSATMSLAVITLPLVPLTWAYAILRYRLMDVDVIFEEGVVYTLATLAVLGIFYGMVFSVSGAGEFSGAAMVAMVLIAAFVFQPIRAWIRDQLDRHYFYKDRYDYRRTLIEFARELGSPSDLHAMLESAAERLIHTLGIRHVAFFVWDDEQQRFRLELANNRAGEQTRQVPEDLDLSFLSTNPSKPYLFYERTRNPIDVTSREMPAPVRRSIAELEMTYYLPCAARGKTIAYLGVSRTETGDFLSSEDVQLLVTLTGYLGIAIENAKLYSSLRRKADEYERLKEFSENIVESIHVGILAADLDDRVESWNTQIERLTGVARRDAVGQRLADLFPADLCEELETSRGASGIQNIYKYDYRQASATLNIATAPLVSKDGGRIGRLIIFDDVTDRANLEQRLIQADKLSSIGLLAAGVAHEVNTPLAVISTYAQMLAKQISGDEKKAPLLEKISRQTFRASEIVNGLLNFSRTSPTEFQPVDPNKLVTDTLALIDHQLGKAGIEVATRLDPAIETIRGNPGKLQQVLLNIVLNARDAMEAHRASLVEMEAHRASLLETEQASDPVVEAPRARLTVATELIGVAAEAQVRIRITDNGPGIERENLPRIFDPFFTTKGAKKGTGLGLSVSYGIAREHGGEIEVESTSGQGTTFILTLPVAAASPVALEQIIGDRSSIPHPPAVLPVRPAAARLGSSGAASSRPAVAVSSAREAVSSPAQPAQATAQVTPQMSANSDRTIQ